MKIAVCDDENASLLLLEKYISRCFKETDCTIEVSLFQSANALEKSIQNQNDYDVLFLDIDMPERDGIDLAVQLEQYGKIPYLMFVSNMEGYVFRSFQARPFRFIRKSHLKEDLPEAIHALLDQEQQKTPASILIETQKESIQLDPFKIIYVECNRKTLRITTEERVLTVTYRLSDMEQLLDRYGFIRIHKGYLVNYRKIFRIEKNEVVLDDQTILPVSRGRLEFVQKEFRRLTL